MNLELQTVSKLELSLLLQMAGLVIATAADPYIHKKRKSLLFLISGLVVSLILQNRLNYYCEVNPGHTFLRVLTGVYGYCICPVVIVLFIKTLEKEKKHRLLWGVTAVNAAVYLTAFFSNMTFTITPDNRFVRGPLGYLCHAVSLGLLLYLLVVPIGKLYHERRSATVIPLLNAGLIIAGVVADLLQESNGTVSYLTVTMVSSCIFYYIWLHLQSAVEYEQALVAEQKIQIMISQIQPHFLYNTLSTIQALCRIDPEKAFDTTEKFGTYLRQNIDSLGSANLIPLAQELQHTKIYTDIEMLRFPYIHMEYDIKDSDYSVPALTIQPIVENAIRHGVRARPNGLVAVRTRREDGNHVIVIEDNGKGFDVNAAASDGKSHIGIQNVRERIEALCGGTMTIESRKGEGTTVTIRIPVRKEAE